MNVMYIDKLYKAKEDDDLEKIARKHGLRSWKDIYIYHRNSKLQQRSPKACTPPKIFPKEELYIPLHPIHEVSFDSEDWDIVTSEEQRKRVLKKAYGWAVEAKVFHWPKILVKYGKKDVKLISPSDITITVLKRLRMGKGTFTTLFDTGKNYRESLDGVYGILRGRSSGARMDEYLLQEITEDGFEEVTERANKVEKMRAREGARQDRARAKKRAKSRASRKRKLKKARASKLAKRAGDRKAASLYRRMLKYGRTRKFLTLTSKAGRVFGLRFVGYVADIICSTYEASLAKEKGEEWALKRAYFRGFTFALVDIMEGYLPNSRPVAKMNERMLSAELEGRADAIELVDESHSLQLESVRTYLRRRCSPSDEKLKWLQSSAVHAHEERRLKPQEKVNYIWAQLVSNIGPESWVEDILDFFETGPAEEKAWLRVAPRYFKPDLWDAYYCPICGDAFSPDAPRALGRKCPVCKRGRKWGGEKKRKWFCIICGNEWRMRRVKCNICGSRQILPTMHVHQPHIIVGKTKVCPNFNCGYERVPSRARFCPVCGWQQYRFCIYCGKEFLPADLARTKERDGSETRCTNPKCRKKPVLEIEEYTNKWCSPCKPKDPRGGLLYYTKTKLPIEAKFCCQCGKDLTQKAHELKPN